MRIAFRCAKMGKSFESQNDFNDYINSETCNDNKAVVDSSFVCCVGLLMRKDKQYTHTKITELIIQLYKVQVINYLVELQARCRFHCRTY